MKLGLVGLPQVGKKTLFELLTGQAAPTNRSTDPLPGLAPVRDARFDRLVAMYRPKKETPAQIEFALLPDLDPDGDRNRALLGHLERVDVVCYLARAFEDETVFHVSGSVDAARDARAFAEELELNDLLFIEKRLERIEKEKGKRTDAQAAARESELLGRMQERLEAGRTLASFELDEEERKLIGSYPLLTRKPVVVVANVGEEAIGDTSSEKRLEKAIPGKDFRFIAVSAKVEQEISQLDTQEREAFLKDLGIARSALDRLTLLCYEALGLISFFTVGEDEVRAWTIRRGARAPQAGRAIHADIERGFIRSEVIRYEDLITLGSEQKVKEAGKLSQRGKDHVVEDGEIHHFLFKV